MKNAAATPRKILDLLVFAVEDINTAPKERRPALLVELRDALAETLNVTSVVAAHMVLCGIQRSAANAGERLDDGAREVITRLLMPSEPTIPSTPDDPDLEAARQKFVGRRCRYRAHNKADPARDFTRGKHICVAVARAPGSEPFPAPRALIAYFDRDDPGDSAYLYQIEIHPSEQSTTSTEPR